MASFNLGRMLRGGLGGAGLGKGLGALFGGALASSPYTLPIAAGAGILSSIFGGESDEDEAERRLKEYLEGLDEDEETTIREGVGAIEGQTATGIKNAGARGERLARSLGRSEDAEAYRLPLQGKVAEAGTTGIKNFMTDTKGFFNRARIQAKGTYAGRPLDLDDDILDSLDVLGDAGFKYSQGRELLDMLSASDKSLQSGFNKETVKPVGLSKKVTEGGLPAMEDPMALLREIYGGGAGGDDDGLYKSGADGKERRFPYKSMKKGLVLYGGGN